MAAFHLFSKLPVELRIKIWVYSVQPRTVDVRAIQASRGHRDTHHSIVPGQADPDPDLYLPVPVPAVMQTCRESRNQRLYEKIIYTHPVGPEQRYAWINFDLDMIDLGQGDVDTVEHIAPRIRKLQFERRTKYGAWFWYAKNKSLFENVEVYKVVTYS
ncbi:hypothetical protein MY3296_000263 [Beauveria thailandica]